jgi:hypothetical protein
MSDSSNSSNPSQQRDAASPKAGKDRRGKAVFLILAVGIALAVYFGLGRGHALLPGWSTNIDQALAQAKADNRRVLAVFLTLPPDDTTSRLIRDTLSREPNPQNIEKGQFIRVKVEVDAAAKDATSKRFGITRLPTLLILGGDGAELNRREGSATLGQMPFSDGFLDLKDVRKAGAPPAPAEGNPRG